MLRKKFELILIKTEFFMNFKLAPKFDKVPCTYSTGSLAKFCQK